MPVVLALLLSLLLAAPAEGAKKPRCPKSKVTVLKQCVRAPAAKPVEGAARLVVAERAMLAVPARGKAERKLRRNVRVLRRHLPALADARQRSAARARAAAASAWTSVEPPAGIDSARVRDNDVAALPVGQRGNGASATVEASANGATLSQTHGRRNGITPCPDPAGVVRGTEEWSLGQGARGAGGNATWSITLSMSYEAQVGDDARVSTYRYALAVDLEVRSALGGKPQPTRRYRVILERDGIDPRRERDWEAEINADPRKFFVGRWFGPRGRNFDADEGTTLALMKMVLSGQIWLEHDANKALLRAEEGWYDRFECVTLDVAQSADGLAEGQTGTVTVVPIADDGKWASGSLVVADVRGGSADPLVGTSAQDVPFVVRFTKDASETGGFDVILTSRRGRGRGDPAFALLKRSWDVRFRADGSYTRTDAQEMLHERRQDATFAWDTTWRDVPLGAEQPYGTTTPVTVTGRATDSGVILNVPFSCEGQVFAYGGEHTDPVGALVTRPVGDGGLELRLVPFGRLDRDPLLCAQGAMPWHAIANAFGDGGAPGPYDAVLRISAKDLEGDRIVRPITGVARQYAPGCADDELDDVIRCEQTAALQGTVTITRRGT